MHSFMIHSLILQGHSTWFIKLVWMANPTSPSLFSPFGFPIQKSVNPEYTLVSCPSSESLVFDSASMSVFKISSSFATRGVLRSGQVDALLSSKVLTFQLQMFRGTVCVSLHSISCFFWLSSCIRRTAISHRKLTSLGLTGNVWSTFSRTFPRIWVNSALPEQGCSDTGTSTQIKLCQWRLENDIMIRFLLSVCRFVAVRFQPMKAAYATSPPSPQGFEEGIMNKNEVMRHLYIIYIGIYACTTPIPLSKSQWLVSSGTAWWCSS